MDSFIAQLNRLDVAGTSKEHSKDAECSNKSENSKEDEKPSSLISLTYWSILPNELQIMIVSKLLLNGDKLNLLAAYPALTPIIAQSWPINQTIESACVLKDPRVEIAYLNGCVPRFHSARYSNSKFCDLFVPQPKVLGVHHDTLTLSGFKEINEHHIILLEALEWTKTSISKLVIESNNFEVAEYFVMHLKTPFIKISNEPYDCIDYKTLQLSELVEKYPKLFKCEELDIHGEIVGNVNDLVKNFAKFTPIIKFGRMDSYYNSAFVTVFDVASFLKKLKDGAKWEENNEGIDSLDRLKRWAFHIYYDAYSAKNSARKRRKYDEDMLHKFMMIDDSNVTWHHGDISNNRIYQHTSFQLEVSTCDRRFNLIVHEEIKNSSYNRAIQIVKDANDFKSMVVEDIPDHSCSCIMHSSASDNDDFTDIDDW